MISRTPSSKSVGVYIDPFHLFNLDGVVRSSVKLSEDCHKTGLAFISGCKEVGLDPADEIKKLGYRVIMSEQDGSFFPLDDSAIYKPTNDAMVRFAESRGWVKAYLDPSSAATRSVAATGADSMADGVTSGSGTHERVALSQTSGDTVSPSVVTARQSLPATTHGSMMTNGSTEPSLPLAIGNAHPSGNSLIYHSTDNPKILDEAAQRSMPYADLIMKKLASSITGAEYCDLSHPSGPDIRYDNSMYVGDSGASALERLIEANIYLDHEGQVPEAIEALGRLAPHIPKSMHLHTPLGQGYGAHSVNFPMDTGVSIRVNFLPKEARGVIEKIRNVANKVKDWTLQDVVAAKREIGDAVASAYDAHRGRVYGSGPLKFSESAASSSYVDRSRVLDMNKPMPQDMVHLGNGSPARVVGLGMNKADLISEASKKGYTAVVSLSESGYIVWEPTGSHYKAETPAMVDYAKTRGFVKVDSLGRQIGD